MIVIIPDLPPDYGLESLRMLAEGALDNMWLLPLFKKGQIQGCEILHIHDQQGGGRESHGLVYLQDEQTGRALIRQLRRATLNGRPVRARQYFERTASRDQRVGLHGPAPLAIVDRRKGDRRRRHLTIEVLARS